MRLHLFAFSLLFTLPSALLAAIPGLVTSPLYRVNANGAEVWTEQLRSSFDPQAQPAWFKKAPHVAAQQEIHLADFEAGGTTEITVEVSEPITSAKVSPASRGIAPRVDGRRLTFSLKGPDKVYVEVNQLAPLAIFANQPFPKLDPKGATFVFGPGAHEPGLLMLKDNESVYLAPGAIVYGGIRANGAKNLHIYGGGILDGGYRYERMVKLDDCSNIRFEGITIRNGVNWQNTLTRCQGLVYRGVKVISFGPGGDGIDPLNSCDVEISDSFFRCTDDCIAIKAPDPRTTSRNLRIFDNTMVGFAFADGVTIGFELNAPEVRDIEVWNCDIILARGGSMVQGHSGFSIICDGPALVHNILFRDLRVEQVEFKLFEAQVTLGTHYGEDLPGRIEDVVVRNVSWQHEAPISIVGFSPRNEVRNVRFEGCTVAGKPLSQAKHLLREGPFVRGTVIQD
jgi:hypothetical protein